MTRIRLRIDLAYDGAPFAGFARQPDQTTVQGTLEGALQRLVGQDVASTGAGRTDRGVHARAQVVHVDLDVASATPEPADHVDRAERALADLDVLRDRLDQLVGPAITIWQVSSASQAFDARFSAVARTYRYRLVDAPAADPILRHDRWHVGQALDVDAMQQAGQALVGELDFASFCRKAPGKHTVRRIERVAVSRPSRGRVDIRIDGTSFCHQQVRSITGCLVEVGRGRRSSSWVGQVLEARDRSVAAAVAPPHGLTLERVSYGRWWPASPPESALG